MLWNNITTLQIAEWRYIKSQPIIDNFSLIPKRWYILDLTVKVKTYLLLKTYQKIFACATWAKPVNPFRERSLFMLYTMYLCIFYFSTDFLSIHFSYMICAALWGSPCPSFWEGGCHGDLRCLASPESTKGIRTMRSSSCGPFKESNRVLCWACLPLEVFNLAAVINSSSHWHTGSLKVDQRLCQSQLTTTTIYM